MKEHEWEIKWRETLSAGIPKVDEENRLFIARANALNRAIIECANKPKVEQVLNLMLKEATHHFWHEEQLFAKWKYPDRANHVAMHAHLTQQLNRGMKGFEEADVSFTWAAKGLYITQLLVEHLVKEDMKYCDFLRKQMAILPAETNLHRPPISLGVNGGNG